MNVKGKVLLQLFNKRTKAR